jgi:hypothetical protein
MCPDLQLSGVDELMTDIELKTHIFRIHSHPVFNNNLTSAFYLTEMPKVRPISYSASILFRRKEAGTSARLASPAVRRQQERVQIKC